MRLSLPFPKYFTCSLTTADHPQPDYYMMRSWSNNSVQITPVAAIYLRVISPSTEPKVCSGYERSPMRGYRLGKLRQGIAFFYLIVNEEGVSDTHPNRVTDAAR